MDGKSVHGLVYGAEIALPDILPECLKLYLMGVF